MSRGAALAAAVALFVVLATANSGGYRYGISDQAFYVPAIAGRLDPGLFPRDRALLEPQMRLWAGDELIAGLAGVLGGHLSSVFGALYVVTLVTLALAAIALARSFGCSWWTIAAFLALLTLRHRIAKTGANSLEGYMHPRMLAFALGLFALASVARGQQAAALLWTLAAAVIHTTTAVWFAGVVVIATAWRRSNRRALLSAGASVVALGAGTLILFPDRFALMDDAWLAVLGEKDYLFPADWPAYAWITNLAYPAMLLVLARRRQTLGLAAPGEPAIVAGLLALVALFLVSVPLTELRIALVVQMQTNRVFWLLDAVVALYVAWWLMEDLTVRVTPRTRTAVAAALVAVSAARGFYVVRIEADRRLVQVNLPDTAWTDVMSWIARQPRSWHVLADPAHGWKYGSSVRVAAFRDTVLETGKDTAMAMYDRAAAMQVAERLHDLQGFDVLTPEDLERLDRRYALDVFVDRTDRTFDRPVLYRNHEFVVYDLR